MTEPVNPDPDRPDQERTAPLDYAPPPGGMSPAVQMTLGVIAALAIVLPLAVFAPMMMGTAGIFLGPLVGIAIASWIAITLRRSERTRAWAAGIWIGVGIAILVDGLCWVAISVSF